MARRFDDSDNLSGGLRFYRENPGEKGTSSGSFADQAKGGHKVNTSSGDKQFTVDQTGRASNFREKNNSKELSGSNSANTGSKTASGAASKLKSNPALKTLSAKAELDDLKRTAQEDGKGAAAAAAGVKGAKAVAGKTGVGTVAVAAINTAQDRINKVGKFFGAKKDIASDKNLAYALLFAVFLSFLPILVFFAVVFFAWRFPDQILRMGFANAQALIGVVQQLVIDNGGASRMAYEVDRGSGNVAIGAPANGAPEPGTYAYKLAQIDWEKAKFQTLPNDSRCEIKTKKVISTIDGKERSVIESVRVSTNPDKELEGIARSNCINNIYPIFNTMMRSQFLREGMHTKMNVRYAYAEPEGADTLKESTSEFQETLREKSLTRIWSKGGTYNKPTPTDKAAWEAMRVRVEDEFFDGSRKINLYTAGKYPQEVVDCANYFVPPNNGAELNGFYQKNIDKMNNDLKCGIDPKDLKLYTTVPPEEWATNPPEPGFDLRTKRAALNVVCDFKSNLLGEEAIENYKTRLKDRINSAAISGFQAMTYADTHQERWLPLKELGGDFYKIAGMQKGQEYNYALDKKKVGTQLEPDAVSRAVGYFNEYSVKKDPGTMTVQEQDYMDGLIEVLNYVGDRSNTASPCNAAIASDGTPAADEAQINTFWNNVYPKFKKAMAGLDFYSDPQKSESISQLYNNLTYEDIFFRMMRVETNVATAGTEDGPQNFNRMNFGVKAYNNAVSLAFGGRFISADEAVVRDNNNQLAIDYDDQTRGIAWRLFDLENPRSITSRVAVAFLDYPQNIPSNLGSTVASIFSPIRNAATERGSIASIVTGESRSAQAATSYDISTLKLDAAGLTDEMKAINPVQNAVFIEALKKTNPEAASKFAKYDECYKEFIPSRLHLLNPSSDKKDLYDNYCRPLFEYKKPAERDQLAVRYSAYHFAMLQADALVYLSDPNKEDTTLNASAPAPSASAAPVAGGGNPTDPSGDTSNRPCPAGTTLVNAQEPVYGPGKVLKHYITLCNVQGITVNVSIAANLNQMITDARAAGISLSGGGFRSYDGQVQARINNGCPDIYNSPSSACSPPTAKPGTSNHGNGEAIDFSNTPSGSAKFNWLKANAARYGLFNLPSESWHWSVNGN